jgi:glutamine amidotransferase
VRFDMPKHASKKKPRLAVIDYGMGNLRSVVRAWEHVGAEAFLVAEPSQIGAADALIFPGQGAIVDTMRLLKATGFDNTIRDWIAADQPFFGICLGLQALFEHSEEGDTTALGIFKGSVKRFVTDPTLKIPHMGWNAVNFEAGAPLTDGLSSGEDQFYFVHSYHIEPQNPELALFHTNYGGQFVSGIHSGNCYATQFHPEKSQAKGLHLYQNFLRSL